VEVGRYARFSGRALATVETTTDSNGNAELWIFVDPTDLILPVKIIKPAVSGNYTNITVVQQLPWSSNPFPFAQSYVSEAGDNPCTRLEELNSYYLGGACLEVTTLNKNAYLATAYQTRTGDNTADRFTHDLGTLWTVAEPAEVLHLRDTAITCMGCVSAYTGASWHVGTAHETGLSADAERFYVSGGFRRCWAFGAPWIRVVVRTTSVPNPSAGPVQLNVVYNCWAGTAPVDMAKAAAQPYETVPLEPPSWLRAVKTRGCHFKDATKLSQYHEMMRRMALRIPAGMAGDSPLQRAVVANPKAMLPALLSAPTSERPAKSGSWIDDVENFVTRGVDFGLKIAPPIMSAVKAIGSLFA